MREFLRNFANGIGDDFHDVHDVNHIQNLSYINDRFSFAMSLGRLYRVGFNLIFFGAALYQIIESFSTPYTWEVIPHFGTGVLISILCGLIYSAIIFTPLLIIPYHFFRRKKMKITMAAYQIKCNEEQEQLKKLEEIEQKRIQKEEEQANWQLQLDREIERERRLAEVRHDSTLMAMKAQVNIYAEYKEKGLSVEKEIFDMRKTLIDLEGQENKAMLDEVNRALNDLEAVR
jgi:hypothetical protein